MKNGYRKGSLKDLVVKKTGSLCKPAPRTTYNPATLSVFESEYSIYPNNGRFIRSHLNLFVDVVHANYPWHFYVDIKIPYLEGYADFDVNGNVAGSIEIKQQGGSVLASRKFVLVSSNKEKIATAIADTLKHFVYNPANAVNVVNYFVTNHLDVFA